MTGTSSLPLAREDVESHVHAMAQTPGVRLADFFGSLEDDQLVIRLVWGLDREHGYLILKQAFRA